MRRTLAVGLCAGVLLVWWFCQDLSLNAQGVPAVATENGDVNADGKRDIGDPIYLLNWLLGDGPAPVPLAFAEEVLGKQVAGSYFFEGEIFSPDPEAPPRVFNWLITLTSDGTFAGNNTTDFGGDTTPRFRSTQRGAWESTGDHEVVARNLSFDYGEEEMFSRGPGNSNVSMPRITMTMVFDAGFEKFQMEALAEIFLPNQDPLDPGEMPIVALEIRGEGRRITAQ